MMDESRMAYVENNLKHPFMESVGENITETSNSVYKIRNRELEEISITYQAHAIVESEIDLIENQNLDVSGNLFQQYQILNNNKGTEKRVAFKNTTSLVNTSSQERYRENGSDTFMSNSLHLDEDEIRESIIHKKFLSPKHMSSLIRDYRNSNEDEANITDLSIDRHAEKREVKKLEDAFKSGFMDINSDEEEPAKHAESIHPKKPKSKLFVQETKVLQK
jgi:hypothetical protein